MSALGDDGHISCSAQVPRGHPTVKSRLLFILVGNNVTGQCSCLSFFSSQDIIGVLTMFSLSETHQHSDGMAFVSYVTLDTDVYGRGTGPQPLCSELGGSPQGMFTSEVARRREAGNGMLPCTLLLSSMLSSPFLA